ncbi:type II toxin-antitoxin system HicA family toxin [bacterium]|nr:type II toxin-antitoxin system HicA family toxin [bacterium]
MSKLPVISGRQCVRVPEQAGFVIARDKSSHIVMKRLDPASRVTVPDHRELAPGILRAIIRQAGMSVDGFVALLD